MSGGSGQKGGAGDEREGFSIARRMLGGMKARADSARPSPGEAAPDQAAADHDGDMLSKLVGALKGAPSVPRRLEPPGYGHLLLVRHDAPIGPGKRGDAVEALQVALLKAGVPAPVPPWLLGRYDEATEAAVRRFQREHGVAETGTFGPETLTALHTALGLDEAPDDADEPDAQAQPLPRSAAARQVLPSTGNAFLDRLAPGAVRGMHETGMPASVLLAMAVLESNWGEALLARDHHNVFGLTGSGPAGSVHMADGGGDLVPSGAGTPYRKYEAAADSVVDFARSFAAARQYEAIMGHRGQPQNFARALSGAFSDDPNYGVVVVRIMTQFDLARFDRVAPARQDW